MKVLWIVNTIFPYPAEQINCNKSVYGGWLNGLANSLVKYNRIKLCIVTTYNGKTLLHFNDSIIDYYLVPGGTIFKYNPRLNKYAKEIIEQFEPNIIHIHGTEFAHSLSFIETVKSLNIPIITSIQGLVSVYSENYFAGISERELKRNYTIRDIIKHDGVFSGKRSFYKRGIYEKSIIRMSDFILGRTCWDYANTKVINPDEKYCIMNEILRDCFYKNSWNIEKVRQHSIFTSQGNYPIKGLHYLIEAISFLKKQYPDVKLYVSGQNIIDTKTLKNRFKMTGYGKYIKKLIHKHHLEENVIFLGQLNEVQMKEQLLKTNVFVLPSAIENSSNALCEAMILGIPCVATNSGGTMDMINHNVEGFLYPYNEPAVCAKYISDFFESTELCITISNSARKKALERHDPRSNIKRLVEIYNNATEYKKRGLQYKYE